MERPAEARRHGVMTKEAESLEKRVRDLEEFAAEVRGGRRLFLWMCSALGAAALLALALWGRLSGNGQ